MLILIHGEDTYSSWQKLMEYTRVGDVFDVKNFDLSLFKEKATASPLFEEPRPVILKGLLSEKKKTNQKDIAAFLQDIVPSSDVVFYEEKTIKTGDIFKLIKALGEFVLFPALNKRELKTWAKNKLQEDGYEVEYKVVELLVSWLGEDLWLIASEIEKLRLSAMDTKKIVADDVTKLSSVQVSGNIFELVDNLGYRNKKETLQILTQILRSGESPHYAWAMVIRQYRLLIQIVDLLEDKKSKDEITKTMKIAPFIVGKVIAQARKYTKQELEMIYTRLLTIDTGIKLGEDLQLHMELLIEDVCN